MCILKLKFLEDDNIYQISLSDTDYTINYAIVVNYLVNDASRNRLSINEPLGHNELENFIKNLVFTQEKPLDEIDYIEITNVDTNKTFKVESDQMAQFIFVQHIKDTNASNLDAPPFNCTLEAVLKIGEYANG